MGQCLTPSCQIQPEITRPEWSRQRVESWDPIKQNISVSGAGQPPTCPDARQLPRMLDSWASSDCLWLVSLAPVGVLILFCLNFLFPLHKGSSAKGCVPPRPALLSYPLATLCHLLPFKGWAMGCGCQSGVIRGAQGIPHHGQDCLPPCDDGKAALEKEGLECVLEM